MQLKRQGIAGIGPWKNTLVSYTPLNYINESVRHLLLGPADAGAAAAAATATNCRLCCQLSPVPPLLLRLAVRVAASTQAHMALIAAVRAVVAPGSPALRRLALHNPGLALRCPVQTIAEGKRTVNRVHKAGLQMHIYTLRNEPK
jgi:hypothetical protein